MPGFDGSTIVQITGGTNTVAEATIEGASTNTVTSATTVESAGTVESATTVTSATTVESAGTVESATNVYALDRLTVSALKDANWDLSSAAAVYPAIAPTGNVTGTLPADANTAVGQVFVVAHTGPMNNVLVAINAADLPRGGPAEGIDGADSITLSTGGKCLLIKTAAKQWLRIV